MAIAFQKSVCLRSIDDHDGSDIVIQDILEEIPKGSADIRVHCGYGCLQLSWAENAILCEEFGIGKQCLGSWEPRLESSSALSSGLELRVVRLKTTALSRLLRYEGQFEDACDPLKQCLEMTQRGASCYHIMHHLADVYCELRDPESAEKLV
ncbi:hypothetical protein RJZ56_005848 [Blastomyces dermatitidis]